jgi:glycosyltransferase involved in cell wall biosynthesis
MHLLIITDAYFPARTSVAILLYELAQTFIEKKVKVSIVIPNANQKEMLDIWVQEGCEIISVKALETKDIRYVRRLLNEFINPWLIWRTLKSSPQFTHLNIGGVIWYSPSIFWGPLIRRLKKSFHCKAYLVLRDIFPDWALHLEVLRKGPLYYFLKSVEQYQYSQADTIGIQSPNSMTYFKLHNPNIVAKLEVLWNWTRPLKTNIKKDCPIIISQTKIAGRIIFVYAGNLGIAQGVQNLLQILERLNDNSEIGFLIIGRGSEALALKELVDVKHLHNTEVYDEIEPFEIPGLLQQCDVGLIFLDRRHRTHNIPGKFVTYLQSGLPVFAVVNQGNDLLSLIPENRIGVVCADQDLETLIRKIVNLAAKIRDGFDFKSDCQRFSNNYLNSNLTADQIINAFNSDA